MIRVGDELEYYGRAELRLQLVLNGITRFRGAVDAARPAPDPNPIIDPKDIIYQYSNYGHSLDLHEPLKSAVFAGREFMDQLIYEANRGAGVKARVTTVKYLRGLLDENPKRTRTKLENHLFRYRGELFLLRALRNLMKAHPDRLEFGLGKDEFIAAAQFPVPNDERDLTALIGYDLGADNYFPMELKAESFMNWLERFSVESMNILLESENNNVDEPGSH